MSLVIELESVYIFDDQIQNKVQCLCKVFFRNATKSIKLYKNEPNVQSELLKSDEFYEEDEVASFLSHTTKKIKFSLGTKIKSDDILRIECYKHTKFHKKYTLFFLFRLLKDNFLFKTIWCLHNATGVINNV